MPVVRAEPYSSHGAGHRWLIHHTFPRSRCGILIYGYSSRPFPDLPPLNPVCSLFPNCLSGTAMPLAAPTGNLGVTLDASFDSPGPLLSPASSTS